MKNTLLITSVLLFSGCWTFNETEFPRTEVSEAAGKAKEKTLSLAGFEALLTEYEAINGFQTVYVPGHYGRRYYHPGYVQTVPVTSYVATKRSSDMFLRRAQDEFEKSGYSLAVASPDITVDVRFEGPIRGTGTELSQFCWRLFSAFLCDYEAVTWTAKLRIRDAKSGKLLFFHDYEQNYETNVFGLIPLFSISACPETSYAHMQSWCLAALTDRAVADATAYLKSGDK